MLHLQIDMDFTVNLLNCEMGVFELVEKISNIQNGKTFRKQKRN